MNEKHNFGASSLKRKENKKFNLTLRQMQVYSGLKLGKRMKALATELGVSYDTIYRDVREIKRSEWYLYNEQRMKALDDLAFVGLMTHLESCNFEAIKGYYKGTGLWKEKFSIDLRGILASMSKEDLEKVIVRAFEETENKVESGETSKDLEAKSDPLNPPNKTGEPESVNDLKDKGIEEK